MGYVQIGFVIIMAFLVSVTFTSLLIPVLQRKHAGQNIREDGPQSHMKKAGTPSMGGLAIITATMFIFIFTVWTRHSFGSEFAVISIAFLLFGALGFLDDYEKIAKHRNLGLRAWQKLVLQIIISVGIAWYMANYSITGTVVYIPFVREYIDFGIWYIPFIAFVIVAMSNSVNLTDGLDGLASGVTSIVSLFFAVAASAFMFEMPMLFCSALFGACLGFLVFNKNPAKIFMGDTGSMALGGGLAVAAIVMNMTLLLPVAGFVYVAEALSVIIQVASFKMTGKRVFKMAPLHHHFELCGLKEKTVVALFWTAALACSVCALAAL